MSEYINYNSKNYEILSKKDLGSGGNWNVYSVTLKEHVIIDNQSIKVFAMKISKYYSCQTVKEYKDTYDTLKLKKIPILSFLEIATYENKDVIITEDYNLRNQDYLIVSAKYQPKDPVMANIMKWTCIECENEKFLSEHKLDCIKNEEQVITELDELADLCEKNRIAISDDALFFTVDLHSKKVFAPFLGDLDTVKCDAERFGFDASKNKDVCMNSLKEFKCNYVL